jgi:hypothetical protein
LAVSYTDVSVVKGHIGIAPGDTSKDAWIGALIPAAEAAVSRYCRRDFRSPTKCLEYYDGTGTPYLVLNRTPVWSVSGVWLDNKGYADVPSGVFGPETQLVDGVDFILSKQGAVEDLYGFPGPRPTRYPSSLLVKLNGVWPSLTRVATAGWLAGGLRRTPGNIKVVYVASDVPADVLYATSLLVARFLRTAPLGGDNVVRERIKDYEYEIGRMSRSNLAAIGEIAQLLAGHVSVPIA